MTAESEPPTRADRRVLLPLYAAGFVTAFGAHSIAASLGVYAGQQQASLLTLGLLLAVYDGAEVILKPIFGSLADRIGPRPVLLGGLLISTGGYTLLFGALAGLALLVTGWAAAAVPTVPALPRQRQTVLDLTRRLRAANFLRPTLTLAAATAALATGVGFLPVIGTHGGMTPVITGAVVSLLALTAVVVQPCAGRARDAGTLSDQLGMTAGIGVAAVGLFAAAVIPPVGGILIAAVLIGAGTGLATPVAFAHLAGTTPPERLGQP